jgi:uncharacterized MAPEG superfamily protein
MTAPLYCLIAGFVLTLVAKLPVLAYQWREGYDHRDPRGQRARLSGIAARARSAHQDAIEAFAPFAAAVLAAHLLGADPRRSSVLAVTWLVARTLHVLAYLADADYLRTGLALLSTVAVLGLFGLAVAAS